MPLPEHVQTPDGIFSQFPIPPMGPNKNETLLEIPSFGGDFHHTWHPRGGMKGSYENRKKDHSGITLDPVVSVSRCTPILLSELSYPASPNDFLVAG